MKEERSELREAKREEKNDNNQKDKEPYKINEMSIISTKEIRKRKFNEERGKIKKKRTTLKMSLQII